MMEFKAGVVYVVALVLTLAALVIAKPCPAVMPRGPEVELECTLPSGTKIQLTSKAGQYVTLECDGNGTYACAELPPTTSPTSAPPSRAMVKNCALPVNESLTCTLEALGATSATSLTLRGVPEGATAITKDHIQDLVNLTALTLVGSGLGAAYANLPTAALAALPSLRRLTVRESRLRLTPDALVGATRLEYLELSASHINEISENVFRGLESLRILNLWGNELRSLQPRALEGLHALDTLDLSTNPLESLGEGVLSAAKNLRVLNIVNAPLGILDEPALRHLDAFEELIILDSRKPLTLGSRALALPKLRFVHLERCGLKVVPGDVLEGARTLRFLSLSHNSLETLPPELLRDAGELRSLNLSHNLLKELTPALFKPIWNLEELNLNHNNLEEFSNDLFESLGQLSTLLARNNRLRVLSPTALRGARRLQFLDLAYNELTLRGPDDLNTGVSDGYIDFDTGRISPMNGLTELRKLDLSHNLVEDVFTDWRYAMLNLELLNLTHNELEILTDPDINFLGKNVVIDYRYNKITTIQISEVLQMVRVDNDQEITGNARILLDGNPFHCDCHMYTLVRLLSTPTFKHISPSLKLDSAICVTPTELENITLRSVPLNKLTCAIAPPECPDNCNCTLHFASNAIELDCIKPPLTIPELSEFGVNRTLLRLGSAPLSLNLSLPVHELLLTGLSLKTPPLGLAPPELEVLDLTNNLLSEVPLDQGQSYRLRLARNPLVCDCAHSERLKPLQHSTPRVEDWYNLTCVNGDLLRLKDMTGLCASARAAWAAGVGGTLAVLGIIVIVLAVLWLRYQNEIKVYCFARGWCGCLTRGRKELPAKYDAFLSFSHKDEYVVVNKLVPELEQRGYRLCVHYRDWAPGESIAEHVSRSVHEARRTLVVVSPGFLGSEWARAEFRAAHARALREGRSRVIVVLLGELPAPDAKEQDDDLRAYLRTNTYLKWGDAWFWEKLQYALPHHPLGEHKETLPLVPLSAGTLSADALRAALEVHLQPKDKLAGGLEPRMLPPPPPAL